MIGLAIVGTTIAFIDSIWNWKRNLGRDKAPIKFKEFLQLYNDDPSKWRLDNWWAGSNPRLETSREYIYCQFNYIDYCRYRFWKWNINRRNKKEHARQQRDRVVAMLNEELRKTPTIIIEDPTPDKAAIKHVIKYLKNTFGEDKVKINEEK